MGTVGKAGDRYLLFLALLGVLVHRRHVSVHSHRFSVSAPAFSVTVRVFSVHEPGMRVDAHCFSVRKHTASVYWRVLSAIERSACHMTSETPMPRRARRPAKSIAAPVRQCGIHACYAAGRLLQSPEEGFLGKEATIAAHVSNFGIHEHPRRFDREPILHALKEVSFCDFQATCIDFSGKKSRLYAK
jgi:hypothetical protein